MLLSFELRMVRFTWKKQNNLTYLFIEAYYWAYCSINTVFPWRSHLKCVYITHMFHLSFFFVLCHFTIKCPPASEWIREHIYFYFVHKGYTCHVMEALMCLLIFTTTRRSKSKQVQWSLWLIKKYQHKHKTALECQSAIGYKQKVGILKKKKKTFV